MLIIMLAGSSGKVAVVFLVSLIAFGSGLVTKMIISSSPNIKMSLPSRFSLQDVPQYYMTTNEQSIDRSISTSPMTQNTGVTYIGNPQKNQEEQGQNLDQTDIEIPANNQNNSNSTEF